MKTAIYYYEVEKTYRELKSALAGCRTYEDVNRALQNLTREDPSPDRAYTKDYPIKFERISYRSDMFVKKVRLGCLWEGDVPVANFDKHMIRFLAEDLGLDLRYDNYNVAVVYDDELMEESETFGSYEEAVAHAEELTVRLPDIDDEFQSAVIWINGWNGTEVSEDGYDYEEEFDTVYGGIASEIRKIIGNRSQREFAQEYDIPLRTVEAWCRGLRTPPDYVLSLLRTAEEKKKGTHN